MNKGNKGENCTVEPFKRRQHILDIKQALADSPRDLALFTIGINVGLRGGDLLRLSWADVLLEGEIRDKLKIKERKTRKRQPNKVRSIAISTNLRAALSAWLSVCVKNKAIDPQDVTKDNLLFPSKVKEGKPMSSTRLYQLVNLWAKKAKVSGHFGSHTLRKTYGYYLRKRGIDLPTLMKIFGHSNQAITLRYLGIDDDEIDEANFKLNL